MVKTDNTRFKNKYFIRAVLSTLFLLCALCFALAFGTFKARAIVNPVTPTLFLPTTEIETNALTDPKDAVYLPDGRIATVQGNDVVVFLSDGTKHTIDDIYSTLKQIKVFGDNSVLVSTSTAIRKIMLNDYTFSNLTGNTGDIGGNYFDLNGNYIITAYGDDLKIYSLSDTITYIDQIPANGDNPIAINENDDILYFVGSNLYKSNVADLSSIHGFGSKAIKGNTNIIANNDYVYYIGGDNAVYRISINDDISTKLSIDATDFDLGKLVSPVSLSFKGDNLLIADDDVDAVQEFKVEGDKLVFTGFAVASDKTAFNRIGKTASDISVAKDSIAVLDDFKLTVIKYASKNLYAQNNYFNLLRTDMAIDPDFAETGNGTVLIAKGTKAAIYSTANGNKIYEHDFEGNDITDVCYIGGYYYLIKTDTGSGADSAIYRLSENGSEAAVALIAEDHFGAATLMTVDVYKNIILSKGGDVYRIEKTDDGYTAPTKINGVALSNVKKIETDLNGNVFALTDAGISYLNKDGEGQSVVISGGVKSFALSFDMKSVFFIRTDDERLYRTLELPNLAADDLTVPASFKTTATSAYISEFKTYKLNDGAISFIISKSGDANKFTYEKTGAGSVNEYVLICATEYQTADELSINISVLLGYDELKKPIYIAVNSDLITETTSVTEKNVKLYTTTDVNAYYYPMITENGEFALTDGDGVLRVSAKTEINVQAEVSFRNDAFNGKFYYARIKNSAGEDVYGYIPENFTVSVLYEDVKGDTEISRVKSENDHSFRNALIVIALAASVFGTSLFFILRKKG